MLCEFSRDPSGERGGAQDKGLGGRSGDSGSQMSSCVSLHKSKT